MSFVSDVIDIEKMSFSNACGGSLGTPDLSEGYPGSNSCCSGGSFLGFVVDVSVKKVKCLLAFGGFLGTPKLSVVYPGLS